MNKRREGTIWIYWDSCIFFAWIKDEQCWSDVIIKGINQTIERAYSGEVVIVTSSIALAEVLQARLTADQKALYKQVFTHQGLQLIDADRRICGKAAVIRDYYDTRIFDKTGRVIGGSFMSLGDAIHVATALHIGVREMHTLDGGGQRARRVDLLRLNGNVAGARLAITKPYYIAPPEHLQGPLPVELPAKQMPLLPDGSTQTPQVSDKQADFQQPSPERKTAPPTSSKLPDG